MNVASRRIRAQRPSRTFEHILVHGFPQHDAPILLRHAACVAAPGSAIRLLEPSAPSPFLRIGAEPLEHVVDSIRRMGVTLHREQAAGAVPDRFVDEVIARRHDLVVKTLSTERQRPRALALLDLQLVRRCPCAVWFVDCGKPGTIRRVAAAVDAEREDDASLRLNRTVLETAAGLAGTLGADLHLLHAWEVFGDLLLRRRMSAAAFEEHLEEVQYLTGLRSRKIREGSGIDLSRAHVHLRRGDLADVLPAFVDEGEIDLVVLGTKGRSGWLDSIVRPRAEEVLAQSPVSILIVKDAAGM